MKNEFITIGETTVMLIKSKNGLFEVKIDTKNIERVSQHTWSIEGYPSRIYVSHRGRKITNLKLHRFIMNCPEDMVIDHCNRDRLDNRESNLKICTLAENLQNKSKTNISNKSSGIKNIVWDKSRNKWKVSIEKNGQRHNIGRYDSLEEAKLWADMAREEHHHFDNVLDMVKKSS